MKNEAADPGGSAAMVESPGFSNQYLLSELVGVSQWAP